MTAFEKILMNIQTPAYVLDLDRVKINIQRIQGSVTYTDFDIHYAMFCNDDEALLKLVKEHGIGVLAINENELQLALRLGFSRKKIHLTGGTFTREQLAKLLLQKIDINLDSLAQLTLAGEIGYGSKIGIRIRLYGEETKGAGEGILLREIDIANEIAEKFKLKIVGVHTYIGTNTLDEQRYLDSASLLASMASKFPDLRYINIGGGFGIPYSLKDNSFNWGKFGKKITEVFEQIRGNEGKKIRLKIEPGRAIVGDAGYFLTRVIESRGEDTLVVDAPYTVFPRPFIYHTNHRVRCLGRGTKETRIFRIRGCSINSNDYLSKPDFEGDSAVLQSSVCAGDLLCFSDVGAYSLPMQMDFLHYEKARTVLVENGIDINR